MAQVALEMDPSLPPVVPAHTPSPRNERGSPRGDCWDYGNTSALPAELSTPEGTDEVRTIIVIIKMTTATIE